MPTTTTSREIIHQPRNRVSRFGQTGIFSKRILMMIDQFYPILGGAEQQALRLGLEMIRSGHHVKILTRQSRADLACEENYKGMEITRLPYIGTAGLPKLRSTLPAVRWLIKHKNEYDLIHCHGSNPLEWAAMIAKKFTHKPYLVKLTNPNFLNYAGADNGFKMKSSAGDSIVRRIVRPLMLPALRLIRKRMIKNAARVLAISPQIVERLSECGFTNMIDIPNGIDTEKIMPAGQEYKLKLRRKLGLSEKAVIFIYSGRFAVEKNLITLLKAWNKLMTDNPKQDLNLIFLGNSNGQIYSSERELKIYARENNLVSLSFKGSVFNVDEYLQASDVFVLPSLWEGMSNALLEAMAAGLPSVVSDIPANQGLVEDHRSGLLFPVENHEALANCLKIMMENPHQRLAMGERAREIAETRYSIEVVAQKLISEYTEILNQTRFMENRA